MKTRKTRVDAVAVEGRGQLLDCFAVARPRTAPAALHATGALAGDSRLSASTTTSWARSESVRPWRGRPRGWPERGASSSAALRHIPGPRARAWRVGLQAALRLRRKCAVLGELARGA